MDLTFETIGLVPIIVAIIEGFKKLGLPVKYAPIVNAVLSVAGYAIIIAAQQDPSIIEPVSRVLTAIIVFLSAAGLYEIAAKPFLSVVKK